MYSWVNFTGTYEVEFVQLDIIPKTLDEVADGTRAAFTTTTKRTNVEDLENNNKLKAGKFNVANFGIKKLGEELYNRSKSNPATGWVKFGVEEEIDVPDEIASIEFNMFLPTAGGGGTKDINFAADNVGFSITVGAGPATPQVSRANNGPLPQNNPVTGIGRKLSYYVKFVDTGAFFIFSNGRITQDAILPVALGKVT